MYQAVITVGHTFLVCLWNVEKYLQVKLAWNTMWSLKVVYYLGHTSPRFDTWKASEITLGYVAPIVYMYIYIYSSSPYIVLKMKYLVNKCKNWNNVTPGVSPT